jgi:hypothetical protein
MYPRFTPDYTVSGNLPDPGYLTGSLDDDAIGYICPVCHYQAIYILCSTTSTHYSTLIDPTPVQSYHTNPQIHL